MNKSKGALNYGNSFTLIEILVSVTIFSLVGAAIYSVFANGLNAWRRGNDNKSYAKNIRILSEKIARDVRNTFEFEGIPFEGTEESVMFPGLIEGRSYDDAVEEYSEVGRIAYFYDSGEDAFCRKEQTFAESLMEEELDEAEILISDVDSLAVSYCYLDNATGAYDWKDDWKEDEQDTIPQAISLEISFKKKAARKDDFNQVIFIPIGTGEQKIDFGNTVSQTTE